MPDATCPHCRSPLDFPTLLLSFNPASIRCQGCDNNIRVSNVVATAVVALLLTGSYALWRLLDTHSVTPNQTLLVMVIGLVGIEYLYFEALRQGWLPSTLTKEPVGIASTPSTQTPCDDTAAAPTAARATIPITIPDTGRPIAECIIPRIQHRRCLPPVLEATDDQPVPPSSINRLINQPLFGDLVLTYAIDTRDGHIALTHDLFEQCQLPTSSIPPSPLKDLFTLAEHNALPSLANIRQLDDGMIKQLTCDHQMMACGILFPALWDQIEHSEGTEVVIAVLHPDHIWYVPSNNPDAIAALKTAMTDVTFDDADLLSRTLYVREEDEWVEFDE